MSTTQIQEAILEERVRCVKIVEQIRDDAYSDTSPTWIYETILKGILGKAPLPTPKASTP